VEPGSLPHVPVGPARAPVRWGIGDFFIVYFAGLFVGLVGGSLASVASGQVAGESANAATIAGSIVGMYLGYAATLVVISRTKGRGSLAADFGARVRVQYWWALVAGAALQIVLGAFVYPLVTLVDENQNIVEELKDSSGAKLAVLLLTAGFLAPIFEEIIFRGLLQRALRRRLLPEYAIAIQAFAFAMAHPFGDPSLGSLAVVPALFALGVISGIAAERTGDLSVSIPLHMGFNLLTLVALVR
jgi:membrane protease YdiL (CAAX protease family)